MPAKNIVKEYIENGYYHLYNRGVEKRDIFLEENDCATFLFYLKLYLSPIKEIEQLVITNNHYKRFLSLSLSNQIDLLSFSLMPNHFHLEVKQNTKDGIIKLTRRVTTSYVMYFNRKYNRVGPLFQNAYKAAMITNETYLLHLSRYIHLNTRKLHNTAINFADFSSYSYYLGKRQASWVKPQEILSYFKRAQSIDLKDLLSYESFVENYFGDSSEVLNDLTLEDD